MIIIGAIVLGAFLFVGLISLLITLRQVVSTNEVHIVQSTKSTISYGKDLPNGNTYYEWPHYLPMIGVIKTVLPVSVFDLQLNQYEAYDKGRLPFVVDVVAFFRVADSNMAAQRVAHFKDLEEQLTLIVRGAIRTVLASHDIDDIMVERSKFGQQFTEMVEEQLENWGVIAVKNIELMDIRDSTGNQVIHNIMEKKKSLIEMQSRSEVAENKKRANIAEIDAQRDTETQKQVALEAVGLRTAKKNQIIGIAEQEANQAIKEQQRVTQEKEMAILKVNQVTQAEINKNVFIVEAEQNKQTLILNAEANLEVKKREADGVAVTAIGQLESKKKEAEGITLEGQARASAEQAWQLAPVNAQIALAKEIGTNEGYQKYLISNRAVEANQAIGVEQAKALEKANIKIIANTGEVSSGIKNVMDIFTSKGGTNIGAMLEGFAQTETGEKILGNLKKKMLQNLKTLCLQVRMTIYRRSNPVPKLADCVYTGKHDCLIRKEPTAFGVAIWRCCKNCSYKTEH